MKLNQSLSQTQIKEKKEMQPIAYDLQLAKIYFNIHIVKSRLIMAPKLPF